MIMVLHPGQSEMVFQLNFEGQGVIKKWHESENN